MANSKKTVLHSWHVENGANMALFGNYDMPLWYKSGVKAEHLSVIQAAGIFDTSHMAVVSVQGEGARSLLQHCLSKDLDSCLGHGKSGLVDGRCVYGVFLKDDGTVIDDAIVYQLQPELFMVVVNAGMGADIAAHLQTQSDDAQVVVQDLTDRVGKMDIQGPESARVLSKILRSPMAVFEGMLYFSFKGGFGELMTSSSVELTDGSPVLISRTGYTGEFGFELFVPIEKLVSLWTMVLGAGSDTGVIPCGLAARDSLRAGAVLPLSHQDIGPWPFLNNPWSFALPFCDDSLNFTKEFIGSAALQQVSWDKYTMPFAGFDPRKIGAGDGSFVTSETGERLGTILTCTTDMAIGRRGDEIVSVAGDSEFQAKGLCCGFVLLDERHKPGDRIILSDGKRKIKVEIRKDVRPNRTARNPIGRMLG